MFAVLHIADFALHAILRTTPNANARPAALFSEAGKKSIVLAANPIARAAGVELGMTAPQAVARCAKLFICTPNAAAETEARAVLLATGFTLSPHIEDTALGVCTIDLRGRSHDAGFRFVSAAVEELRGHALPATAGIADTPLLALYAAKSAEQSRSRSLTPTRSLGTLEFREFERTSRSKKTRTNETDEASVLRVTNSASFLAPLPLAVAEPTPELAAVLTGWGLRTLGDLLALPRDEIIRRFGAEGLSLWQRASGGAARPLRPVVLAPTFSATTDFEEEIETLEPLLFVLRRFLERLTLELRASQHVATDLQLGLRLEDDTRHARGFRLPEPTASTDILFRALHTHLESLHTAASIVGLDLRLTPARPLVRQQGLFETGLRDPHGFAETLARVSALVGPERVGTPQIEDTYRPDAVKLVAPLSVIPPRAEPPLHSPMGLPLRRFRPPLPVRVEFTDGAPTFLWNDHARGEISFQSRACTSSGDWWQNDRAWRRTEWDIGLADGGLYRLVHTEEAYFLEGEYD